MAWTQPTNPVIKSLTVPFRVPLYATVQRGDALSFDTTHDACILADADSVAAHCFALQDGVSGDVIWAALGVEISSNDDSAIAAAGDVGSPLYISATAGDVSLSAGTVAQAVGYVTSTTSAILVTGAYLTTTSLTLSGALSVGTTAAVTGDTTLGGTLAVTGNTTLGGTLTVASGKDVTLTKGDLKMTDGYIQQVAVTALSADQVLTAAMCGNVSVDTGAAADIAITLPAAAAGLEYTIFQVAGSKNIVITSGTGDFILGDGAADDNTATLTSEIGGSIVLRAMDATNWVVLAEHGTWAYTKV